MSTENEGSIDSSQDFSPEEVAEFEGEQSSEQTEAAPLTPSEQKAIEKLERSYKLKVNGKEVEEKIDLNNEDEVRKHLQLSKAAQEAMAKSAASQKQIAAMEAEMDQFLQILKNDPMKILSNPALGLKVEELADKILAQKIEEASKSPEQIELEKARAKLAEYEQKIKDEEAARQAAERQKLEADAEAHIQSEIMEAIDAGSLPKSPYIINKMAQLASIAFDNNIDVNMKDLAPIVKKMYQRDIREMMSGMKDDEIEDLVSPDRIKAIRNARIQAARGKISQATKIVDTGSKPSKQPEKPVVRRRLDSDW
jgi:hypothetical protein